MKRSFILLVLTLMVLVAGCSRLPRTGVTALRPASIGELQGYLLKNKPDLDEFRLRGPFSVQTRKDIEVLLSPTERISADLYSTERAEKTSLVILLHGYANSKDDHAYQAMHLASWGIHSLAVQLPNTGPWTGNGRILARLADFIYRHPEVIDRRIDVNRIVLAGHSFGAASVAIAMAEGAPAVGGILLDPAGIGRDLPKFLGRINKPVMVLGADAQVSQTRDRDYFYTFIRNGVAEISIRNASHEDAQYPAEFPMQLLSSATSDTEEHQITFVSTLTSAAFSLGATGKFDYAWISFGDGIRAGRLFNAKRK